LTNSIDHTDREIDWSAVLEYTASEWCSEGDLIFTYQKKYDEETEWTSSPASAGTQSWSVDETDMHLWTNWKVEFKNSKYDQADAVVEAAADLEVIETCRPAFKDGAAHFLPITKSEEKEYTINFDLEWSLAGTGLHNCKDLGVSYTLRD